MDNVDKYLINEINLFFDIIDKIPFGSILAIGDYIGDAFKDIPELQDLLQFQFDDDFSYEGIYPDYYFLLNKDSIQCFVSIR